MRWVFGKREFSLTSPLNLTNKLPTFLGVCGCLRAFRVTRWEIKQKRPRGARPRHPFPLRAPATDAAPRTPAESRALRLLV